MFRKTLVASALAGLLALGAAATASAESAPATPQWIAVFYFGTQTYCPQAGAMGQQLGTLQPGAWRCDSGRLMVQSPQMG